MTAETSPTRVAIACGGTGGHLFPGMAVAEELARRGCAVTLLISPKQVDQEAAKGCTGMEVVTLPAVGLSRGRALAFIGGFFRSARAAACAFREKPPQAALAMGGFTSAPPILAAKRLGARTFLHESNSIPGRANRWLSRVVPCGFIGFPSAAARLRCARVTLTGTPVRSRLGRLEPGACRAELGLDPQRPVILVMGGSQGASGVNRMLVESLPALARSAPNWQWFHLSGPGDVDTVAAAYLAAGLKALVLPFFERMELALGAATAAISRAGASSLAELAALRLPAVLVPFPQATDNHQFHNAKAFSESGAARLLEQNGASAIALSGMLEELVRPGSVREGVQAALAKWHTPDAAGQIAGIICAEIANARLELAKPGLGASPGGSRSSRLSPRSMAPPRAPAPAALTPLAATTQEAG